MRVKYIDFIFIFFILTTIFTYFSFYSLNVDSTWILHCAEEMVLGSKLYIDVLDVNPPLVFVYSTLSIYISNIISISIMNSYVIFVISLIFISTLFCWKILKNMKFNFTNALRYYIYSIIIILSILISFNFGQREHLFMIFILPYILMMTYKEEINISNYLKIAIAVFASLGFNIKPHFFLIFLVIELFYIIYKKDLLYIFRVESLIIILSAFLYIILIFVYFPEYITFMVPFAIDTYIDVFNQPLEIMIFNYEFYFTVFTLIFFMILFKDKISFSNNILLLSIFSSIILYLIQQKGWSYHRVPFFILSLIFLTHLSFVKFNKNSFFFIILIPLIMTISYHNAYFNNIIKIQQNSSLKKIINEIPENNNVLIVSTDIAQGLYLLKSTQIWSSRFPSMFMLPALKQKNDLPAKKYTFNAIFKDILKYRPSHIIFPSKGKKYNYYDFYINQDKRIKDYFSKYYIISTKNNHIVLSKQNSIKNKIK